jgi:rhodanese-related sulfurtransferase
MRVARWMLLILLVTLALAACAPGGSDESLAAFVSPQEAQAMLDGDENVVLLDVRTEGEWVNDGHAPEAVLIPLDELEGRVDELDSEATILVICRSGNRSQVGAQILRDQGFAWVSEVEGGMRNWSAQGQEVACEVASCTFQ